MEEVLNPMLYKRLLRYYDGDVEIVHAGEEILWETVWDPDSKSTSRNVISSGEEYKAKCMTCRDHRSRLHINHRWGVYDAETDSRNLWLVNCYNENCYTDYEPQKWLYEAVFAQSVRNRNHMVVRPGKPADLSRIEKVELPGLVYRLDVLVERMPGHPALQYLRARGFDPTFLGKYWGVGYCIRSRYHHAADRIIIPILYQGMMVGWQARYIGDDVNGVPFNVAKVPKYWSSPNYRRSLVAYNLERAMRHSTVVAVEGPADAWNVGPMAFAAIGKTFSKVVVNQLVAGMEKHGSDAIVVIALDPKQDAREKAKGRLHPIERLYDQLYQPFGNRVVRVYLPEEHDPGSMDRAWFRKLVKAQAAAQGLTVSFGRPK